MRCPVCGTKRTVNITTIGEMEEHYLCREGHHFQEVEFRPVPVEMRPGWIITHGWAAYVAVFCGPDAPYPTVPTPEEILAAAR